MEDETQDTSPGRSKRSPEELKADMEKGREEFRARKAREAAAGGEAEPKTNEPEDTPPETED